MHPSRLLETDQQIKDVVLMEQAREGLSPNIQVLIKGVNKLLMQYDTD